MQRDRQARYRRAPEARSLPAAEADIRREAVAADTHPAGDNPVAGAGSRPAVEVGSHQAAEVDSHLVAGVDSHPAAEAEADSHRVPEAGSRPVGPTIRSPASRPALLFVVEPVSCFVRLCALFLDGRVVGEGRSLMISRRRLLTCHRSVEARNDRFVRPGRA